ncbi:MAG TPA: helix-turn-helix domain-containing protein [Solirubrobacterales bacterium]|nr:helix-turn-helix domain-containing protein [Solirubrobacterales bacterium]
MGKERKRQKEGTAAPKQKGKAPPKKQGKRKTNRLEAMRHPLRSRMLRLLVERGVMSPSELSAALEAELSNVSYHMHRLEELECAELVETRPVRGAVEHFYRAIERHLIETEEFEELDPISAEDLLANSFQRILDDFVASRRAKMIGFDKHFHLTRTPMILDAKGYEDGMALYERSRLAMSEIERESAERLGDSEAGAIAISANFLLFKVPPASLDT